jgi:hypothetical protein
MTITYSNGRKLNAALIARNADHLRVAVEGSEDVLVLTQYKGCWITEECEAVRIEFTWEKRRPLDSIAEEDCICPKDLAARLIQSLLEGSDDEPEASIPLEAPRSARAIHVI